MNRRIASLTPTAPARVHLVLAALLWTVVGVVLAVVGGRWAVHAAPRGLAWWMAAAVLVGLVKARLVLVRVAARIAARIRARGDGRCVGGFLSARSWALVAVMAGGGRLLRASPVPTVVVGLLYLAVGVALASASLALWRELAAPAV